MKKPVYGFPCCLGVPYDLTPEFLEELFTKHNIDYVVHGDDPCLLPDGSDAYAHAKQQGRFRMVTLSLVPLSVLLLLIKSRVSILVSFVVSLPVYFWHMLQNCFSDLNEHRQIIPMCCKLLNVCIEVSICNYAILVFMSQIKRTEGVSSTDIVGRMLMCTRANPTFQMVVPPSPMKSSPASLHSVYFSSTSVQLLPASQCFSVLQHSCLTEFDKILTRAARSPYLISGGFHMLALISSYSYETYAMWKCNTDSVYARAHSTGLV